MNNNERSLERIAVALESMLEIMKKDREKKVPIKKQVSDPNFEIFFKNYPKKIDKASAMRAWFKILPDQTLFEKINKCVNDLKKSKNWLKDNGQFIPHPTTFLNQRRWEDELPINSVEDEWK